MRIAKCELRTLRIPLLHERRNVTLAGFGGQGETQKRVIVCVCVRKSVLPQTRLLNFRRMGRQSGRYLLGARKRDKGYTGSSGWAKWAAKKATKKKPAASSTLAVAAMAIPRRFGCPSPPPPTPPSTVRRVRLNKKTTIMEELSSIQRLVICFTWLTRCECFLNVCQRNLFCVCFAVVACVDFDLSLWAECVHASIINEGGSMPAVVEARERHERLEASPAPQTPDMGERLPAEQRPSPPYVRSPSPPPHIE